MICTIQNIKVDIIEKSDGCMAILIDEKIIIIALYIPPKTSKFYAPKGKKKDLNVFTNLEKTLDIIENTMTLKYKKKIFVGDFNMTMRDIINNHKLQ